MPGIFGASAVNRQRNPVRVAEAMSGLLTHQDWYARLLDSEQSTSLGAVSTNPWFSRSSRMARRPEGRLLLDGTAITIDGEPIPDDTPDLAQRLFELYLESEDRFPSRIGGHFKLVIDDRRQGTVRLINDRLGFAHLFWYADEDLFLFGPELKAFLAWRGFDRTLDQGSFGALLASQCPFGTRTLFRRVSMLAPATQLTWHEGQVSVERYWRPEPEPRHDRPIDQLLDEALILYQRSVDKRIPGSWQGRVVIPLSGGLDSRLLFWLIRAHGDRLELFTHGQRHCTDAVIARQAAESLDLAHRHQLVSIDPEWSGEYARQAVWLNDGQLNLRNATLIGIAKERGPGPVPFLNGIIGAFMSLGVGGFVSEADLQHIADEDQLREKLLTAWNMNNSRLRLRQIMPGAQADRMAEQANEQVWESFSDYRHVELFGDQKSLHFNANLGRRMQGTVDANKYYFHNLLPFVDEELFRFWLGIPLSERMGNKLYIELYRRKIPKLAGVPWSYTGLDLHATDDQARNAAAAKARQDLRHRMVRKYSLGLINLPSREHYNHREIWLRKKGGFRRLMRDTLQDAGATGCPWFDQKLVNRLFCRFDRGGDHHLTLLLQVATVVLWHELFLKKATMGKELTDHPAPSDV